MSDPVERAVEGLRLEYLSEAPSRLAELRKDVAAFVAGEPDAVETLRRGFHRLAGSGGSYGFPRISELARETEQWISTSPQPGPEPAQRLEAAVQRLAEAFASAASELAREKSPLRG